jgi:hypothetical protein
VLKENFRAWNREADRSWAKRILLLLEERAEGDSLPEFKKFLYTG